MTSFLFSKLSIVLNIFTIWKKNKHLKQKPVENTTQEPERQISYDVRKEFVFKRRFAILILRALCIVTV